MKSRLLARVEHRPRIAGEGERVETVWHLSVTAAGLRSLFVGEFECPDPGLELGDASVQPRNVAGLLGIRREEILVFLVQRLELVLQTLDVSFFAFPECPL